MQRVLRIRISVFHCIVQPYHSSFVLARSFHTSSVQQSSKEARQARCVKKLLKLGVDYKGSLRDAKQTLNAYMLHDAKLLGITEIGNGNNRNLSDRLVPRLIEECEKLKLPVYGDYEDLRPRLQDTLFAKAIKFDNPENITRTSPLEPVAAGAGKKRKDKKSKKTKVDLV